MQHYSNHSQRNSQNNSPTDKAQNTKNTISDMVGWVTGNEKADSTTPVNIGHGDLKEMTKEAPTSRAVIEYRDCPDTPVVVIAAKHDCATATLIEQARRAGIPGRKRGGKRMKEPAARIRALLARIGSVAVAELAKEENCSKQAIYRLKHRWPNWVPAKPKPHQELVVGNRAIKSQGPVKQHILCFRVTDPELAAIRLAAELVVLSKKRSVSHLARHILLGALHHSSPTGKDPS